MAVDLPDDFLTTGGEEKLNSLELEEGTFHRPQRAGEPGAKLRQRIRTPDHLEVVGQMMEPELVQAEPDQWKKIGEEVSPRLDYQPGKLFWQETRQQQVNLAA